MQSQGQTTLLVDGKFFLYRSLNANALLTRNDMVTSTYYYFLMGVKSIAKKFQVDNTIILWDSNHSYRRGIFPTYKQKDTIKDENLAGQIDIIQSEYETIKMMINYLGFASYLRYGLEADDLFCLYCEQFRHNEDIIIASKDEDLYQLLHEKVKMFDPKKKHIKDKKWFQKEYGIEPEQWGLVKAMGGCHSDKIPGIAGVGEETALKYIRGELNNTKKIKENNETVEFFLKLTLLPFQNPGQRKLLKLKPRYTNLNMDRFIDLCQRMGFKSFLEKLDEWEIFTRN